MVHARPVQPPATVPPTCLIAGLLRDGVPELTGTRDRTVGTIPASIGNAVLEDPRPSRVA